MGVSWLQLWEDTGAQYRPFWTLNQELVVASQLCATFQLFGGR